MAWEAWEKGYSCNDCMYCRGNKPPAELACDFEVGLCDEFEPLAEGEVCNDER